MNSLLTVSAFHTIFSSNFQEFLDLNLIFDFFTWSFFWESFFDLAGIVFVFTAFSLPFIFVIKFIWRTFSFKI